MLQVKLDWKIQKYYATEASAGNIRYITTIPFNMSVIGITVTTNKTFYEGDRVTAPVQLLYNTSGNVPNIELVTHEVTKNIYNYRGWQTTGFSIASLPAGTSIGMRIPQLDIGDAVIEGGSEFSPICITLVLEPSEDGIYYSYWQWDSIGYSQYNPPTSLDFHNSLRSIPWDSDIVAISWVKGAPSGIQATLRTKEMNEGFIIKEFTELYTIDFSSSSNYELFNDKIINASSIIGIYDSSTIEDIYFEQVTIGLWYKRRG